VREYVLPLIVPESQSGDAVGSSHDAPHAVLVCELYEPAKSQTTVSPALITVSQTPSWNEELEKYEGSLFPDTYLFPKDSTIDTIITIMTNNFEEKYKTLDTSRVNFSKEEIITLASLIEREAKHSDDRLRVSSVIHNRLDLGMKLDIDATLQYTLGFQPDEKRWWKKSLTNDDKKVNSPYNTYTRAGLPPGPISNPGLLSLEAAISPAQTDYLYYITDSSGQNRYAQTLEEHEENISKYGL